MANTTGFVRVAKSGTTIDGREIKAEWLLEAAACYDPVNIYRAVVFPEHQIDYGSYGSVEALKTITEKDGSVSLYADIQPNAFWLSDARYGRKLYTSVSLLPNFAKTGKWYMYSLGATDTPASLGVEQLQFSKTKQDGILLTIPVEFDWQPVTDNAENPDEIPSWFKKLLNFSKTNTEHEPMTPQEKVAFEKLSQDFAALKIEHEALKKGADGKPAEQPTAEQYAALKTENDNLKIKVSELEAKVTAFSTVETKLAELEVKFTEATKEVQGTKFTPPAGNPQAAEEYAAAV